jgi:response regulator RpfG family c-di-GMP phosphodiesterase
VDDDPRLLAGLELRLRRSYEVVTATSAAEALGKVNRAEPFAVVISDMRMPGPDGATFLSVMRRIAPQTVRILLTGYASLESATAAVNQGEIFKFLSKPCETEVLLEALHAATEQHRLLAAERRMLAETLVGSVQVMTELLALVSPLVFGRAARIKVIAGELAEQLSSAERWSVEFAAIASHFALTTLPEATIERLYYGEDLSEEDARTVRRLYEASSTMLAPIPRLEDVRQAVQAQWLRYDGKGVPVSSPRGDDIPLAARILRVASDFDALISRGESKDSAKAMLSARQGVYDSAIVDALAGVHDPTTGSLVRDVPLGQLEPGMRIMNDVSLPNGSMFIPRGLLVTAATRERFANLPSDALAHRVRVAIPSAR